MPDMPNMNSWNQIVPTTEATALPDLAIPGGEIEFQVDLDANGRIEVGGGSVRFQMEAGDLEWFEIFNANEVYVRGNGSDILRYRAKMVAVGQRRTSV